MPSLRASRWPIGGLEVASVAAAWVLGAPCGCARVESPIANGRASDPVRTAAPLPPLPPPPLPPSSPAPPSAPKGERALVVHEWGTFTSMVAPDGSLLGGLHHSDEALPPFVAKASTQLAAQADGYVHEPTQRMETPVLYVYSDEAMDLDVEVAFPFGLMSEWYPDAAEVQPQTPAVERVADGRLRWLVRVEPDAAPSLLAPVGDESVWAPSRRVAAQLLRTTQRRATRSGPEQWERLLFYRGVGDFALPVTLAERDDGLVVSFGGQRTIAAAWLLTVEAERAALRPLGAMRPGETRVVDQLVPDAPLEQVVAAASASLHAGLRDAGLYDDEARAMIDTWRRAWLRTPGTRLLYVLPRPWTDALLPLRVRPRPQQTERVLVGRVELLSRRVAAHDESALGALAAQASARAPGALGWMLLEQVQPFAEPRLRWLCPRQEPGPRSEVCRRALRWAHRR